MALEEKTNNVKYQGRDDYKVVYFDVEEESGNVKYFFLDEGKDRLANGNIIATTNLKVAIGANKPEELADIGVVSPEGKVVIPFDNRKIKVLTDNILLAEPAKPVSENVVKALEDRGNPQEATRLVTAANTIKGKISNSVGPEGKFVFNDLCSEATIYDIDGNNLVDGKYFSFIGMNEENMFLSSNDPESDVVTLSLTGEVKEESNEAVSEEVLESAEGIDVGEVSVDENVVEDAFKEQEEPVDETIVQEEPVTDEEETTVGEAPLVDVEESAEEESVSEEPVAEEEVVEETTEEAVPVEEAQEVSEEEDLEDKTLTDLVAFTPDEEDASEDIDELDESDLEEENRFDSSKVQVDSIKDFDVEEDSFNSTDMAEGTAIVEKMINKMKEQDGKIANLERQLLEQRDTNRAIMRKAKEQDEKLAMLSSENDKLEEKSNYYRRVASSLSEENNTLKGQLEDKEKLLYMLKEAKKLLNGDDDLEYNSFDDTFYGKVA